MFHFNVFIFFMVAMSYDLNIYANFKHVLIIHVQIQLVAKSCVFVSLSSTVIGGLHPVDFPRSRLQSKKHLKL